MGKEPNQTEISKMQFVGGCPDEWCIFVDDLIEDEKGKITDMKGNYIDVYNEI